MKKNTRRDFLKLVSAAPAGTLLFSLGCSDIATRNPDSTHTDSGNSDAGNPDAGSINLKNNDSGQSTGIEDLRNDTHAIDMKRDTADTADTADAFADIAPETCDPTGSDVEGPFHIADAPHRTKLASTNEKGSPLRVEGRVVDENCKPLSGVSLDIWHADNKGDYHEKNDPSGEKYRLRGQITTDKNGTYSFESIMPGRYLLGESLRPAHIHFIASKPGYLPLTTQLYFEDDPI